eukprot:s367_g36.t1
MEPLRSDVWSAETLQRGVHHANSQPNDLLALHSYSDEALRAQLEDRLPTSTVELKAEVAEEATVPGDLSYMAAPESPMKDAQVEDNQFEDTHVENTQVEDPGVEDTQVQASIDKSPPILPRPPAFPVPAVATPCRAPEGGPREEPPVPTTPSSQSSQQNMGKRPDPKVLRISEAAADARLRRTMQPSLKDGSYKVSAEVLKQYRKGGKAKKSLMKIFETCGYDKDRF